MAEAQTIGWLKSFLTSERYSTKAPLNAISLFSGAGLSDLGYESAGVRFTVQVELNEQRAALGAKNFLGVTWVVGEVARNLSKIADGHRAAAVGALDVLVATPPCQGMSSSNPSRGKRHTPQAAKMEQKNGLILDVIAVAEELQPRVIVAENVRQIRTLNVTKDGVAHRVMDLLRDGLSGYHVFEGMVNVADYGIPQDRRRAIIVAVRQNEPWLKRIIDQQRLPWPRPTHAETAGNGRHGWLTVREWFEAMQYEQIDSSSAKKAKGKDALHFVPDYDANRYLMVRDIAPNSGCNAYGNDRCPECSYKPVATGLAYCPGCQAVMRNRPIVYEDGVARLIKGFASSYRRMHPDLPSATVTTNSSHIGSDFKIHPYENRVLSMLECGDLQTVPRWYDWSHATNAGRWYSIRQVIGEAFPPYFTMLHGRLLYRLLTGEAVAADELASANAPGLGHRKTPVPGENEGLATAEEVPDVR